MLAVSEFAEGERHLPDDVRAVEIDLSNELTVYLNSGEAAIGAFRGDPGDRLPVELNRCAKTWASVPPIGRGARTGCALRIPLACEADLRT